MIHRIGISIEILVQGQRNPLAARMLIHADEAPHLRVIVPCSEVNESGVAVRVFAGVAVADRMGCCVVGGHAFITAQFHPEGVIAVAVAGGVAVGVGLGQ